MRTARDAPRAGAIRGPGARCASHKQFGPIRVPEGGDRHSCGTGASHAPMGEKGNGKWLRAVYLIVRRVLYWVVPLVLAPWLYCAYSDYLSAQRKFDLIESDQSKPGTRVTLTPLELNSWVEQEVTAAVPDGVRNPRLELGSGSATGSA